MTRQKLEAPDWGLATIAGVSLHTPAWNCVNTYLLTDPAPKEFANRPRGGVDGEYGGPGYQTTWSVELEINIIGDWDQYGALVADPRRGEEDHWQYLVENVYEAVTDSQGRVTAVVTSADPTKQFEGMVQLKNCRREPISGTSCCFLEVQLPSGGLRRVSI